MIRYAHTSARPRRGTKPVSRSRLRLAPIGLLVATALVSALVAPTAAVAATSRTLFGAVDKPSQAAVASKRSANVGVKFASSASGKITALKFYRGPKQKRAYTGSLWSSTGKLLAKVTFKKSTKVGWQTAKLKTSVSIKKNTNYVASYLAKGGRYPVTASAFAAGLSHDGITVPAKGGLISYATKSHKPSKASTANYFVDIVFSPSAASVLITDAQLQAAATQRVYFGHQSVGWNVVSGVSALYSDHRISPPAVSQISTQSDLAAGSTGVFAHGEVGENGDPKGKLAAFNTLMRAGLAGKVNVAVVKYCFVDISSGTDVTALFANYQSVMGALERDYPGVTFLYATNPLTTDGGSDNVARTKFNKLIRAAYASTGRVWDIAAVESTKPDGGRVAGTSGGQPYEALYSGYSDDGGHLNAAGSAAAAAALLRLVAQAG
jgi:hypothetical protein